MCGLNSDAMMRAEVSEELPGACGTMSLMGRVG
jgi:hypothetical protein